MRLLRLLLISSFFCSTLYHLLSPSLLSVDHLLFVYHLLSSLSIISSPLSMLCSPWISPFALLLSSLCCLVLHSTAPYCFSFLSFSSFTDIYPLFLLLFMFRCLLLLLSYCDCIPIRCGERFDCRVCGLCES
jgi:hypothetical protein